VWWKANKADWQYFKGHRVTWCEAAATEYGLIHVPGVSQKGLGRSVIHTGGNGGYQAVNLAYLMGAKRICLLGYDMQMTDDRAHWFGQHQSTTNPNAAMCKKWGSNFDGLYADLVSEGVEVINCSRETALNVPRMDLDECLQLR
jgi:hypothetical protein